MWIRNVAVVAAAIVLGGLRSAPVRSAEPAIKLPEGISLEEPCTDPALTKIVLVAGSNFFKPGQHEYIGGCAVLMNLLRQTPGIFPVLALDWPEKPDTLAGAKAAVLFFDGGDKHPMLRKNCRADIQKLADAHAGLVGFHQCIDVPKDSGDVVRSWMGAAFEKGHSQRAHWVADFTLFPDHPICRGVAPFTIDDGWLYKLRFVPGMSGITPLLRTTSPKAKSALPPDEAIVSWAYVRPHGGRSFTFTGGHLHSSLAEEGYRRFLVNGILWSAGTEIPASGAPVALDASQLNRYLPERPAFTGK